MNRSNWFHVKTPSHSLDKKSQPAMCLRYFTFSHNASERKHKCKASTIHKENEKFLSVCLHLCLLQARFHGEISVLVLLLRRRANARNVSTPLLPNGGITYLINLFDYANLYIVFQFPTDAAPVSLQTISTALVLGSLMKWKVSRKFGLSSFAVNYRLEYI